MDDFVESEQEDHKLRELLTSWRFSDMYDHFKKNKITVENIVNLKKYHIKMLFEKYGDFLVGDLMRFESCLATYCIDQNSSQTTRSIGSTLNLSDLLSKCQHGDKLIKYFEEHKRFEEDQRKLLIDSLAAYIYANKLPSTLSSCKDLERQIVEFFPGEDLHSYTDGRKGRIYVKLANARRAAFNKIPFSEENGSDSGFSNDDEEKIMEILASMRKPGISAEQFDKFWAQTYQYRFRSIENAARTADILAQWPEYKLEAGSRFVDLDFEKKFPDSTTLLTEWAVKKPQILKMLKSKVQNSKVLKQLTRISDLNEDSQNLLLLWALHYILPLSAYHDDNKQRVKPSINDSQQAFALIATSLEEIDKKIQILQLKGVPIQPLLLIVGEVTNVTKTFVYLDGIKYPFVNLVQAADVCFKLFYLFHLEYPQNAKAYYTFVQSYFYQINSPSMSKYPKINSLIKDLNASN